MSWRARFLLCMALVAVLLTVFTCWALKQAPTPRVDNRATEHLEP